MHITYDDFKFYLGETIEYCQTIEHDIKWIYSMLLKGEPNVTFDSIRKDSLGMVVNKLEPMDKSDGNPFFSNEDYKLIKQITSERNYLCHEIYRTFLYINNFLNSKEFLLLAKG